MQSLHQNLSPTISLAQSVFQLCGAYGMAPYAQVDSGDFLTVAQAAMPDPRAFNDPESYAHAYQSWNLLRKFSSFPINIDRQMAASTNFDESEVMCGQTNTLASAVAWIPGVPLELQPQSVLELARSLIGKALGPFDPSEWEASCDFSNGASTRLPRKTGNPVFKLDGKPHVTINCRDLAVQFIWANESWRKFFQDKYGRESDPYTWLQLVPGSRFETVSKTSLTDRPICIEPELNMFFQKGIGKMIRRRLLRRGINLNSQLCNQLAALYGSLYDTVATIDLSSASDSVSLWICEFLLPEDWFQAMLQCRSAYVLKDGKYVRLEKISSMGNGFTFELESLIFWGITKAAVILSGGSTEHLTVYGDDIICDSASAPTVIRTLESVGFKTNLNKTFVKGPFRESCGKHYFMGADVTPFKIEDPIETWADLYHFCNSLQEWKWADPRAIESIITQALKPIPPRNRCYVPPSFGSKTGLRVQEPRKKPVYDKELGAHVYKFHYMREVVNDHDMNGPVAYLSSKLLREQRAGSQYVEEAPHVPRTGVRDQNGRFFDRVNLSDWVDEVLASYEVGTDVDYSQLSRKEDTNWERVSGSVSVWCGLAA